MRHRSDDFKLYTLPEGKYQTALEVVESILWCLNDNNPKSKVEVENEWNVTFNSCDEWIAITLPVARALGWLTSENVPGVQTSTSLTQAITVVMNGV